MFGWTDVTASWFWEHCRLKDPLYVINSLTQLDRDPASSAHKISILATQSYNSSENARRTRTKLFTLEALIRKIFSVSALFSLGGASLLVHDRNLYNTWTTRTYTHTACVTHENASRLPAHSLYQHHDMELGCILMRKNLTARTHAHSQKSSDTWNFQTVHARMCKSATISENFTQRTVETSNAQRELARAPKTM